MIRLFFLHDSRISESIITLKFDKFIIPTPAHTYICFGTHRKDFNILDLYNQHDIDTSNFTVIFDDDLIDNFDNVKMRHGPWISQQLLKLVALDQCTEKNILIQDCDTFFFKPYVCFENNLPVLSTLYKDSPVYSWTNTESYYPHMTVFSGINRQTENSFITEFMPITKMAWSNLKERIELIHNDNWYTSILKNIKNSYPGFSEYELLGNWQLFQNPTLKQIDQRRKWVDKHNFNNYQLGNITFDELENAICFNHIVFTDNEIKIFTDNIMRD
jgi:hypothetical protein